MPYYNVSVTCDQIVPDEALSRDDATEMPPKEAEIKVLASSKKHAVEYALDSWHRTYPVACLDDFQIEAFPVRIWQVPANERYQYVQLDIAGEEVRYG